MSFIFILVSVYFKIKGTSVLSSIPLDQISVIKNKIDITKECIITKVVQFKANSNYKLSSLSFQIRSYFT